MKARWLIAMALALPFAAQADGGSSGESGEELSTADSETVTCGQCQQPLLVLAAAAGPRPDASAGACPVCGQPIAIGRGRIILGVPVRRG